MRPARLRALHAAGARHRRPSPRRHGVARLARDGLELVLELLAEDEFAAGPSAGIVVQAYLRDSPDDARSRHRLASSSTAGRSRSSSGWSRAPTGITRSSRRAVMAGPRPSSRTKPTATATSRLLTRRLLEARPLVRVAVASHNLRSVVSRDRMQPRPRRRDRDVEFQVLRGLGDDLQHALARAACACERTARWVTSWPGWPIWSAGCSRTRATSRFSQHRPRRKRRGAAGGSMRPFSNEPHAELRRAPVREELIAALRALDRRCRGGFRSGSATSAARQRASSRPTRAGPSGVATCGPRNERRRRRAVEIASEGPACWGRRPADRARRAFTAAAEVLRRRRGELTALEVRECAKPWVEADADVCEAIDFIEYYARQALELEEGRPLHGRARRAQRDALPPAWSVRSDLALELPAGDPGRHGRRCACSRQHRRPETGRAIAGIWDSPASRLCARRGCRRKRFHLLPGRGRRRRGARPAPGRRDDRIHRLARGRPRDHRGGRKRPPGQRQVKRVVAEMGGKNCVIVDADADLDDAVPAIVASAFAYAGQKCSAAARVLVHEAIADDLLRAHRRSHRPAPGWPGRGLLDTGAAADRAGRPGACPLLSGASSARRRLCESGPSPCRPAAGSCRRRLRRTCPRIARCSRTRSSARCWPRRRASVEAACDIVDGLDYALTGGLYSRNPSTVDYVVSRSPVGNLYVNRQITGAMVGRQPFGGNRLSGYGFKAGGPDYLLQFVTRRSSRRTPCGTASSSDERWWNYHVPRLLRRGTSIGSGVLRPSASVPWPCRCRYA